MTKKKRRGRRHRAHVSAAHSTGTATTLRTLELPRLPKQVSERGSPTRVGDLAERHRYALAGVKCSLVIGGAMFTLLIILYLILG